MNPKLFNYLYLFSSICFIKVVKVNNPYLEIYKYINIFFFVNWI